MKDLSIQLCVKQQEDAYSIAKQLSNPSFCQSLHPMVKKHIKNVFTQGIRLITINLDTPTTKEAAIIMRTIHYEYRNLVLSSTLFGPNSVNERHNIVAYFKLPSSIESIKAAFIKRKINLKPELISFNS